jgi:hypothetical protein
MSGNPVVAFRLARHDREALAYVAGAVGVAETAYVRAALCRALGETLAALAARTGRKGADQFHVIVSDDTGSALDSPAEAA